MNKFINVFWNKYYGPDEQYPDEDNYRVISAIVFNRSVTLICVWKKLHFYLSMSENLQTQWDEMAGPPKERVWEFRIL